MNDPSHRYGPYAVGDHVVEHSSFFGLVFAAGPRQFRVVWESGQVTHHAQDYRGFPRALATAWHGDRRRSSSAVSSSA